MNKEDLNTLAAVEKWTHGVFVLIFSLSFLFSYASLAQIFDFTNGDGLQFLIGVNIINILINTLNIVVILANYYYNYKFRNFFSKRPMKHQSMLFIVFIPAGIFSMAYRTIRIIGIFEDHIVQYAEAVNVFLNFSIFVLLISFIINVNTHFDYGEVWRLNLMNMVTIEITAISQISTLMVFVVREQIFAFSNAQSLTSHMAEIITEESVTYVIRSLGQLLSSVCHKFEIMACIVSVALLVEPLSRHYLYVQHHKRAHLIQTVERHDHAQTRYPSIPSVALCSASVATIVTLMVTGANELTETNYLRIAMSILYISLIINIYFMYEDITKCTFKENDKVINGFFLWLGLFGQTVQAIAQIQHGIHLSIITTTSQENIMIIIIEYSLIIIQCFSQNVLIASVVERNVQILPHNSIRRFISSPHYLFVLNILCFLLTIYDISKPMPPIPSSPFFVKLFENGFMFFGVVFALLHRAYAAVVLLEYFK